MDNVDLEVPDRKVSNAASWLSSFGPNLSKVARNGGTCLFWYVAALLAQYKEQQCPTESAMPTNMSERNELTVNT